MVLHRPSKLARLTGHLELKKRIGVENSNRLECGIINSMCLICLVGLRRIRYSRREAGTSRAYLLRRSPQTRPKVKSLQTLRDYTSLENHGASRSTPFR